MNSLRRALRSATCPRSARASTAPDATDDYHFAIPVPCNGASTPFIFTGNVYPGTYKVSVTGGLSNLPQGTPYVARSSLAVSGGLSTLPQGSPFVAITSLSVP